MQEMSYTVQAIRASMTTVDVRHTFFQDPVRVEDALGRIWPFPSEYSVVELEAIVYQKFLGQPGEEEVKAGSYEIFNQRNHEQIISSEYSFGLLPGMNVRMAIVMQSDVSAKEPICPNASCDSSDIKEVSTGGYEWYVRYMICDL